MGKENGCVAVGRLITAENLKREGDQFNVFRGHFDHRTVGMPCAEHYAVRLRAVGA